MENINLEDYYVSVEYLNNFVDNDIDKWISEGNSEKINKKLKTLNKSGGSFTANNYQVSSTDPVLLPFMYQQGGKHIIEFAETRFIHFFPQINIFNDNVNSDIKLNTDSNGEKNMKRKHKEESADNNKITNPIKTEFVSPKKKKRKIQDSEVDNFSVVQEIKMEKVILEPPIPIESSKKKKSKKHSLLGTVIEPVETETPIEVLNISDNQNQLINTTEFCTKKKKKSKKFDENEINIKTEETISEKVDIDILTENTVAEKIKKKKHKKSILISNEISEVNPKTEEENVDQATSIVSDLQQVTNIHKKKKKHKKSDVTSHETVAIVNEIHLKSEKGTNDSRIDIDEISEKDISMVTESHEAATNQKKKHKKKKHRDSADCQNESLKFEKLQMSFKENPLSD